MARILEAETLSVQPGDRPSLDTLNRICDRMCGVILDCLRSCTPGGLAAALLMTEPLQLDYTIDQVMISGGVADFVYDQRDCSSLEDVACYGDIGPLFSNRLRQLWGSGDVPLIRPVETIRATVIGAGAQTVDDVSGSTILVDGELLPFKNVPVALTPPDLALKPREEITAAVSRSIDTCFEQENLENLAIGLRGCGYLSFARIVSLAEGIIDGARKLTAAGMPLIIVLQQDIGKVLGQSLRALVKGVGIVCIDQLEVQEGDYIDIGRSMAGAGLVAVMLRGDVSSVKAAVAAVTLAAERLGRVISTTVIARTAEGLEEVIGSVGGCEAAPQTGVPAVLTEPAGDTEGGPGPEQFESMSVVKLRAYARTLPGFSMSREEIRSARKQDLIDRILEYYRKMQG